VTLFATITVAPSYRKHILDSLKEIDNIEIFDYEIHVKGEKISELKVNKVF